MSENLPNIDDLFRKALEEHEDSPSQNVWANIDKNLDKKKVVFISEKYRKLKWVAAALLIFSAGMAMYTVHTRMRNKELVRQNESTKRKMLKASAPNMHSDANNVTDKPTNVAKAQKLPDTSSSQQSSIAKTDGAGESMARGDKSTSGSNDLTGETNLIGHEKEVGKSQQTKSVKDISVRSSTPSKSKRNAIAGSLNSSVETKSKSQTPTAILLAEKGNKPDSKANTSTMASKDETALKTAVRDVDLATARANEKSFLIVKPVAIISDKQSVSSVINNEKANEGVVSHQKSTIKPYKSAKLSATIFYSPDLVWSHLDEDHHNFREDDRNEIKNKERIVNSSSEGVLISYNIGKSWSLQSGLVLSSQTTEIQPKTIFARPDDRGNINYRFNCSAGYSFVTVKSGTRPASGDSIVALSSKNTLQYFSIPLALTYNISLARRFTLQPGVGVRANVLTKGSIETEIAAQGGNEKSNLNQIEGLNTSYLNGSISLAATYYVSKKIGLSFTPVTRFALSAINKNAPVKTYLNSFGLAAGLTFGF